MTRLRPVEAMSQPKSSRARYRTFVEDYRHQRLDDETEKKEGTPAGATPPAPEEKKPEKGSGFAGLRGKRREYARDYLRWLKPHRRAIALVFLFALFVA